jgi:hypothetical protein
MISESEFLERVLEKWYIEVDHGELLPSFGGYLFPQNAIGVASFCPILPSQSNIFEVPIAVMDAMGVDQ